MSPDLHRTLTRHYAPSELPEAFPDPLFANAPSKAMLEAAEALQSQLRELGRRIGHDFDAAEGGKMFGLLLVRSASGELGAIAAFSGMLGGQWLVEGFAPPTFDVAAKDAFWLEEEPLLRRRSEEIQRLVDAPERQRLHRERHALAARQEAELADLKQRHKQAKTRRRREREAGASVARLHELSQESRTHKSERRQRVAAHSAALAPMDQRLAELDDTIRTLESERAEHSKGLMRRIHDTYELIDAGGRSRSLRSFYGPHEPPSGAGDCAGPKLLVCAHRHGLEPIELGEFWWGAPPSTGGRRHGHFYASCRGKCGPLMPFLLSGLSVQTRAPYGADHIDASEPRVMFEDQWLVIVDKPAGLLSQPGRDPRLADSVLTRLQARMSDLSGPVLVHRLDLDTSGLLVAAKDKETHELMQRLFSERKIKKRYLAILEGELPAERGRIELPLRGDPEDRPRQVVDQENGKAARTDYQRLRNEGGRTRVALYPRTGRTHQLRVHAAHQDGLDAPIVGDRLYGSEAQRLMLHAESLRFEHPRTGKTVQVDCPAPF